MGRLDRWYLAIGLAACVVYRCLPASNGGQAMYTAIALAMPVAGLVALRRDQPQPRRAWSVLTAGFAIIGLSEVCCLLFITLNAWPAWENSADLPFVIGYVVQLAGLIMVVHSRTTSRSNASWLDAVAVGVAAFTIVWSTVSDRILDNASSSTLSWATQIAEPVLGVALFAMALRLVLGERRGYALFGMLTLGYAVQSGADLSANLVKSYPAGGWIDTMWLVGYVLFGASLLHPGRLGLPRQAPSAQARSEVNQALALQGAVIIAVIGAIATRAKLLVPVSILVVWVLGGAVLLVVNRLRVYALVRLVGEASTTESHRRLTALVDNSHEVIALAGPDGVLLYVSSAIESVASRPAGDWVGLSLHDVAELPGAGLHDLVERVAHVAPLECITWEADVRPTPGGALRTMKFTVVNHVDTPEVNGWVITARDVTDEARLTSELRHQALHDTLTGLPNRALLFDRIENALARVQRAPHTQLAVVLVDLDDFKAVNDSLGHDTGDALLQAVAERLSAAVRPGDTVARLGGDEFALLLESTTETEAVLVAQRALESLQMPVRLGDGEFTAQASVGVACHQGPADPIELLRFADIAMYEAKREGKARVKLFREHMHLAARNQLDLRMNLAAALDRDEFTLVYQPIFDTQLFSICGVEALLRWVHPTRGPVPPSEFIPVAEQSGLLTPIGEWVLRKACTDAVGWSTELDAPYLSVNVSAAQISDRGFVGKVMRALDDSGFPAHRLLLEVTETMLVDDDAQASIVLAQLRAAGIRIAIDDFGTGYSSLAYLRQLSVDVVKIDQSFVRDLNTNSDHQALTRTMLALADGLSMTAIAEGVETPEELEELRRLGCGFAQGYLFSRPVGTDSIAALVLAGGTQPALDRASAVAAGG